MSDMDSLSDRQSSGSDMGGIVGGAIRQAELMAAEEDRYEPPSDGELDQDQVEEYIRVMTRTREMMTEKAQRRDVRGDRDRGVPG